MRSDIQELKAKLAAPVLKAEQSTPEPAKAEDEGLKQFII